VRGGQVDEPPGKNFLPRVGGGGLVYAFFSLIHSLQETKSIIT